MKFDYNEAIFCQASVQSVHSILSKPLQLHVFNSLFTNFVMIVRIFCQLMRAYNMTKFLKYVRRNVCNTAVVTDIKV